MKNHDDSMQWFPLWVDKWIFGSTRIEFQPDERAVWVDLMAIAAKDNGHIRANPTTPYPLRQLAGLFCITEELLQRTIQRCLETNKLEENFITSQPKSKIGQSDEEKVFVGYRIVNWEVFQLSGRHKRRFQIMSSKADTMSKKADTMSKKADTMSKKADTMSKKADTRVEKRRENNIKEDNRRKGEEEIIERRKTTLPLDFKISDRVKIWAKEKKINHLEDHLESFKNKCTAHAYRYVDWDSAFMEAIRKDWAGIKNTGLCQAQENNPFTICPNCKQETLKSDLREEGCFKCMKRPSLDEIQEMLKLKTLVKTMP